MPKDVKISVVLPEEYNEEGYRGCSKYYYVDCMGNRNYIHCRDRAKCQQVVDDLHGKNKYKIRTDINEKGGGSVSCRGSVNSLSRKGLLHQTIKNGQGRGL